MVFTIMLQIEKGGRSVPPAAVRLFCVFRIMTDRLRCCFPCRGHPLSLSIRSRASICSPAPRRPPPASSEDRTFLLVCGAYLIGENNSKTVLTRSRERGIIEMRTGNAYFRESLLIRSQAQTGLGFLFAGPRRVVRKMTGQDRNSENRLRSLLPSQSDTGEKAP